jgi:phage tail sheath protein FI
MATVYKTPGVYIEEISKFPPSVAQVETAIPAFVGYTEMAVVDGVDYHTEKIVQPVKVRSLPEYEFFFGSAPKPTGIEIELNADNTVKKATVNGDNLLYDSVRMFYANGGGDCYIVSVGKFREEGEAASKDALVGGLQSIEKADEPTLLVIPESVKLNASEAGEVHVAMLTQCNKLQDRFALLDIVGGDKEPPPTYNPVADFRGNVGMNFLKYGAAYYPWIKTTLSFNVDYNAIIKGTYTRVDNPGTPIDIKALLNSEVIAKIEAIEEDIKKEEALTKPATASIDDRDALVAYANALYTYAKAFFGLSFNDNSEEDENSAKKTHSRFIASDSNFHGLLKRLFDYNHFSKASESGLPSEWDNPLIADDFTADFNPFTFAAPNDSNAIFKTTETVESAAPYFEVLHRKLEQLISDFFSELKALKESQAKTLSEIDPVYQGIMSAIRKKGIVLPPGSTIAGIYAMVDRERGVWKAPANVSLTAVKGPAVNITNEEQEGLNIDTTAGKSINAIRAFTGKGTLVWGARTLAGNDNEWRYVPVRRFFIMVEESVKKATEQFVFEPNDANTWVKIRAMVENFLFIQWRAGALAGAKQEHAFYVRIGLGQTMTAQDILDGYMHVEIGLAVVRPAEFIVLKFSHKMQES